MLGLEPISFHTRKEAEVQKLFAILLLTAAAGCSSGSSSSALTQAQVQQDAANVIYLMQAAGCVVSSLGTAAAPIIAISADAKGNQVLQATSQTGANLCNLTVPASALPAPAPAGAAAATSS